MADGMVWLDGWCGGGVVSVAGVVAGGGRGHVIVLLVVEGVAEGVIVVGVILWLWRCSGGLLL